MDEPESASSSDERSAAPPSPVVPAANADATVSAPPVQDEPATRDRKKARTPRPANGGVKETLESILVAFILAFIFRAFVVEAFVIPTGSMAPTLLGAHLRYTCPDCGYRFDGDYRTPGHGDDTDIPEHAGPVLVSEASKGQPARYQDVIYEVRCPNCGTQLPDDVNPRVYYGDRILVLKYIYLLQEPRRWDVVVFKSPVDPAKTNYSVNYIKRLVGKPNEWIMVLDGDIYVAPTEDGPWAIQTKPRYAQEALWRIIYDNDFQPVGGSPTTPGRDGQRWTQPWRRFDADPNAYWDTGEKAGAPASRVFTFTGMKGSATLQFDPDRNHPVPVPAFRDWLAYDQTSLPREGQGGNTVRDFKLQFDYTRQQGEGPLLLKMTKYDDVFIAEIGPGSVKLTHESRTGALLGEKTAERVPLNRGVHHVEFTNVDYQVTLRVDDVDLLKTSPQEYHPDIDTLKDADARNRSLRSPPTVGISARNQDCRLEHVSLCRDVYYTPGAYQGGPRTPAHLGPDEYFVCGDNSVASLDSRLWRDPIDLPDESLKAEPGRVPGRFLLGRAFFVYWPAGFRPAEKLPGLVPNFGEMRFIR